MAKVIDRGDPAADAAINGIGAADSAGTAPAAKSADASYGAAELAGAARRLFGASPDLAMAALRMAGRASATMAEAGKIVKDFMDRKVK